ncbi:MAG: hypothetical protein ACE5EH_13050 [Gammaproteobacteria bacterium]
MSSNDVKTQTLELGTDHNLQIRNFRGIISPGLILREIKSSSSKSSDLSPSLSINLSRDAHSIAFNYGINRQNRSVANTVDMKTITTVVSYRYQQGKNSFGVEANRTDIGVSPGQDTTADKISVFWTHRFEKSFKLKAEITPQPFSSLSKFQKPGKFGASSLLMLRPGIRSKVVNRVAAERGLVDPIKIGQTEIFETVVLKTICVFWPIMNTDSG